MTHFMIDTNIRRKYQKINKEGRVTFFIIFTYIRRTYQMKYGGKTVTCFYDFQKYKEKISKDK